MALTNAQKQARHVKRQAKRGYRLFRAYVHDEDRERVAAYVKRLTAARGRA